MPCNLVDKHSLGQDEGPAFMLWLTMASSGALPVQQGPHKAATCVFINQTLRPCHLRLFEHVQTITFHLMPYLLLTWAFAVCMAVVLLCCSGTAHDLPCLRAGCGARCTHDGLHYSNATYDAALQIWANLLRTSL